MKEVSEFTNGPPDAETVLGNIFYGKDSGKMFDLTS